MCIWLVDDLKPCALKKGTNTTNNFQDFCSSRMKKNLDKLDILTPYFHLNHIYFIDKYTWTHISKNYIIFWM